MRHGSRKCSRTKSPWVPAPRCCYPEGGERRLAPSDENTMPKEAMEAKERQMVALGAKLVEQKQVQRTAMEAGMEEASTSSLLRHLRQECLARLYRGAEMVRHLPQH
jgi:hypothetical protein